MDCLFSEQKLAAANALVELLPFSMMTEIHCLAIAVHPAFAGRNDWEAAVYDGSKLDHARLVVHGHCDHLPAGCWFGFGSDLELRVILHHVEARMTGTPSIPVLVVSESHDSADQLGFVGLLCDRFHYWPCNLGLLRILSEE